MIIDVHTHIYPDALAPKATAKLSGEAGVVPCNDGTFADNEKKSKEAGVDMYVSLNIAVKPDSENKVNAFAIATDGGRCVSFGSVNPYSRDIYKKLETLALAGIKGVKLHPEYQRFHVLSKEAFKLCDILSDFDFAVTVHAGWDVAYPDDDNANPRDLAALCEKYHRLRFNFAHMGGMKRWDAALECLAGRDCMLDTAMCAGALDTETFLKIVEKHGCDRIMFGSDSPWQSPAETLARLDGAGLRDEDKEKILYKNAERFLKL